MTRFFAEDIPFVQISDGMRLWFVTEEGSYPWNMKDSAGEGMPWLKEYEPLMQRIQLTRLGK